MANVKPVPDGYHTLTPYIVVDGAADAIAFYQKAFGAEEIYRMPGPGGKVMHAEIQIGDSRLMLSDAIPEMGGRSPKSLGGSPASILIYVRDVDAAFARAVGAGATVDMPLMDMFWGDRYGKVKDPFGHLCQIATHVEDVSPEEMGNRAAAAMG